MHPTSKVFPSPERDRLRPNEVLLPDALMMACSVQVPQASADVVFPPPVCKSAPTARVFPSAQRERPPKASTGNTIRGDYLGNLRSASNRLRPDKVFAPVRRYSSYVRASDSSRVIMQARGHCESVTGHSRVTVDLEEHALPSAGDPAIVIEGVADGVHLRPYPLCPR